MSAMASRTVSTVPSPTALPELVEGHRRPEAGHVGAGSSSITRPVSSVVICRTGPSKLWRAEISHQSPTAMITTATVTGA